MGKRKGFLLLCGNCGRELSFMNAWLVEPQLMLLMDFVRQYA